MDDPGAVPVSAEGDPHGDGALRYWALKDGDCFVVSDPHGDITGGPDGLFDADTRLLSRLRLLIGDRRPTMLSRLGSAGTPGLGRRAHALGSA